MHSRPSSTSMFVRSSYKMPKMLLRRSSSMRLGTAALPLCLSWAFVACLAICSDRSKDSDANYMQVKAQSIAESHHSDDCPIAASSFVLPERQSSFRTWEMSVGAHSTSLPCPLSNSHASQYLMFGSHFHVTSAPLLERLGILRI